MGRKEEVEIVVEMVEAFMEGKKSFDTRGTWRFKSGNSSRTVMLELIREYEWNFKRGAWVLSRTKVRTAQPSFKETFFPPVDQPFPNFQR